MPKFALSDMELDEISLCPEGDNGPAKVVLAKAAAPTLKDRIIDLFRVNKIDPDEAIVVLNQTKSGESGQESDTVDPSSTDPTEEGMGEKSETEVTKDDLPESVKAILAKQEETIAALQEQVDALTSEEEEEDETEDVLEKADPAVRSLIEKMQADTAAAERRAQEAESIAKAERSERVRKEVLAKASNLTHINRDPENLADLMIALREKDETLAGQVEELFKAANEQISEGALYLNIGRGGAETTISKSVEGVVAEIMKADPTLTKEQAMTEAFSRKPDLYEQMMKERG